jgi:hypothetical protein
MNGAANYQHTLVLDDIAAVTAKLAPEALSEMVSNIIRLANNATFQTPQADLNDKGKIFAFHQLIMMTSNSENLQAFTAAQCPPAVLRRINYFVKVTVKPQFRKEGTTMVDSEKVAAYLDAEYATDTGRVADNHDF